MTKKRKVLSIVLILLIVLTLCFIWSNSIKGQSESSEQSSGVYNQVVEITNKVIGEEKAEKVFSVITRHVFRKIAHFSEFFLLGLESALLYICIKRIKKLAVLELLGFGLIVASIDEVIQIFSKRGPAIVDVCIDYMGYLSALVITFFIIFIVLSCRIKRKRKSTEPKKDKK